MIRPVAAIRWTLSRCQALCLSVSCPSCDWATAEQNRALLHFGSNIKANSPICCLVWIQWSKSEIIPLPEAAYNCLAGVSGVLIPGQCSWARVSPGGYPVAGWDKLKGQPCLSSGLGSLWAWKQETLKGWKEERANPLPCCVTWGKSSYLLSPGFTQLTSQAWANVALCGDGC